MMKESHYRLILFLMIGYVPSQLVSMDFTPKDPDQSSVSAQGEHALNKRPERLEQVEKTQPTIEPKKIGYQHLLDFSTLRQPKMNDLLELLNNENANGVKPADRLVTDRMVNKLFKDFGRHDEELKDEPLRKLVLRVVKIPKIVSVDFELLTNPSSKISESAFQATIDSVQDVSGDIIDRFFDVQCDSHETLKKYVKWLQYHLLPTIQDLLIDQKTSITDKFTEAMSVKLSQIKQDKQKLGSDLQLVAMKRNDALIEHTFFGVGTLALPVLAVGALPGKENGPIRTIFYTAFAGLTLLNLYKIVSRLDQSFKEDDLLTKKSNEFEKLQNRISKTRVPKPFLDLLDERMDQFIKNRKNAIDVFVQKEQRRIHEKIEQQRQITQQAQKKIVNLTKENPQSPAAAPNIVGKNAPENLSLPDTQSPSKVSNVFDVIQEGFFRLAKLFS